MFCRNCGQPYVTDEAVLCVKCGTQKGLGYNFCPACGRPTPPKTSICLSCGVSLLDFARTGNKSKIAAGLLALFLGGFGAHNFYLGYTGKAVVQLVCMILGILTACFVVGYFVVLGISIWAFIEMIMIFTGTINRDADGFLLKD